MRSRFSSGRPLPTAEEKAWPCCLLCLHVRPRKPEQLLWPWGAWECVGRAGTGKAQQQQQQALLPNLSPNLFSTQAPLSPFPSFPLVGAACPGPASMLYSVLPES